MSATAEAPGPSRSRRLLAMALLRDSFWGTTWGWLLRRVVVVLLGTYLVLLVVLVALENILLHPGAYFRIGWREPPPGPPPEDVELTSETGDTIHAWWFKPAGWRPEHGAVHYSHGNGENVAHASSAAVHWRAALGRAVLVYDYPGYGKSSGRPSEAGCYAAGDAAYRWLVEVQQMPPDEVILVGSSLGAAIATELATRHDHALLVLIAPFTSFPDIAAAKVPYLPARWLARNRMNNREKVSRVKAPVFVTHGDQDAVVPHEMGEQVYAAAREPKRFLHLPDHGHYPPRGPELFAAVRDFLAEVKAK